MNQTKGDEEEMSELIELAKLVQIYLTIETVTPAKKSQLVRYSKAAISIQHSVFSHSIFGIQCRTPKIIQCGSIYVTEAVVTRKPWM